VGEAAVVVDEAQLAEGIRRAIAGREQLSSAGLDRARLFTWRSTAESTLAVYQDVLRR